MLGGGASLAAIGGGRAIYNTVLGYGQFGMGTNLLEQDIEPIATERMVPTYEESIDGTPIRADSRGIDIGEGDRLDFETETEADAETIDSRYELDGRLVDLFSDLSAVYADEYTFEFHEPSTFFERLDGEPTRPDIVTAIRTNWDRDVEPSTAETFTGADPTDPAAVIDGLVEGFREHTSYDVPRYLAGSVEDNVIFGAADLRQYFEDDVSFDALLEADETGIFCWELVFRSTEALQSVSAAEQTVPVAACYVSDRRHKHAFTGILSAVRDGGELRFPMTFVDYTYATLYDDFRLTGVLGEGLDAYGDGHRADEIYW